MTHNFPVTDYREQLLVLAGAFSAATGKSEARIANLTAGSGMFFVNIRNGKTCTVDTFLSVKRWFRDNWPEGQPWPAAVDQWGLDEGVAPQPDQAA